MKKVLKLLSISLISFTLMMNPLKAATIKQWTIDLCKSGITSPCSGKGNSTPSAAWCSNVASYQYHLKGLNETKSVSQIGLYLVDGKTAFCVEPGTRLGNGFSVSGNDLTAINNSQSKAELVKQIVSFAYSNNTDVCSFSKDERDKIYGAQALIWEVVRGERTKFTQEAPDSPGSNTDTLYSVLSTNTNSRVKNIYNEYRRIIKAIQGTFIARTNGIGDSTGKFKATEDGASKIKLVWNGSKYTTTIKDTNFTYWKVESYTSGLEVTKTNDKITISSKTPIDASKPSVIKIKANTNTGNINLFVNSDLQDIVSIGGKTINSFLKVYTSKYQMKIKKVDKVQSKPIANAKFQICKTSSCTGSSVLTTVTTDKNGEATYNELPNPGTYYIKEISVSSEYILNSTPISVSVTTSHESGTGSYATKTVTNENKEFKLIKYTIDENNKKTKLVDGCGTNNYTGPEFQIRDSKGNLLYFTSLSNGKYALSTKDKKDSTSSLKTCNGEFKVYYLPNNCNTYSITESKAPEGMTLTGDATTKATSCSISLTNGFSGVEFQKKNEDGEFIDGGKYSLQKKENNVYKDVLLRANEDGDYEYDNLLTTKADDATYLITTVDGVALIKKLPAGHYRIVEKEAPEGYDIIKDKDVTTLFEIKNSETSYNLVEMIDRKSNLNGSTSTAELIVTIITGRNVINYGLIIIPLVIILVVLLINRKKVFKNKK